MTLLIALIRKLKLALDVSGFIGSISRNGPWKLGVVLGEDISCPGCPVQITSVRYKQKEESLSNIISIIRVIQMVGSTY